MFVGGKMHRKVCVLLILLHLEILAGCATLRSCPDVEDEPVSVCRAEVACGRGKPTLALGMILSGMGGGLSRTNRNSASENYDRCVENELSAQRANAGTTSNVFYCDQRDLGGGRTEIKCRE